MLRLTTQTRLADDGDTVIDLVEGVRVVARGYFGLGKHNRSEAFLGSLEATFAAAMCLERALSAHITCEHPSRPGLRALLHKAARFVLNKVDYKVDAPSTSASILAPLDRVPTSVTATFSGGMDSTTALFRMLSLGMKVHAVSFDTRQAGYSGHTWSEQQAQHSLVRIAKTLYEPRITSTVNNSLKITIKPKTGRILWLKALRNPMLLLCALTRTPHRPDAVTLSAQAGDRILDNDSAFVSALDRALGLPILTPNVGLYATDEIAFLLHYGRLLTPIYPYTYSCQTGRRTGKDFFCCGVCTSCLQRSLGMALSPLNVDPELFDSMPVAPEIIPRLRAYYRSSWTQCKQLREYTTRAKRTDQQIPFYALFLRLHALRAPNAHALVSLIPKEHRAAAEHWRDQSMRGYYRTLNGFFAGGMNDYGVRNIHEGAL